jgi:DNA (cytosine-5)-methyltransferase 1
MRAIDLYSGIGGWTLGLRMAGIDTIASYELWDGAIQTYAGNFSKSPIKANIRELPLSAFQTDVDAVVGSPPCTPFSFSNRGGNGDIPEGLRDIRKFLEVVKHVSPRFWLMENVPRVAGILEEELKPRGSLRRFANLFEVITIVDMTDFGLPQRRKRMLAGAFPMELLDSYKGKELPVTLGQVISTLGEDPIVDPIYGLVLKQDDLRGNEPEPPLTAEEVRLNREAKEYHRVYNSMKFPDSCDTTARTVTAVCTRVSRESIVIKDGSRGFRRLTIRERATLQGFPVTFQLYGESYTDRLQMIGNAVPPVLAFYVGQSLRSVQPESAKLPRESKFQHRIPRMLPPQTQPAPLRDRYPQKRRFRSVLPYLGFGSGVRFELANDVNDRRSCWAVAFYFGTPKDIRSLGLNERLLARATLVVRSRTFRTATRSALGELEKRLHPVSAASLQSVWSHAGSGMHPFELVDALGHAALQIHAAIPAPSLDSVREFVWRELKRRSGKGGPCPSDRLSENSSRIFSGLIVGSWFNVWPGLNLTRRRKT